MLIQECDQLAQRDVAHRAPAEVGHEQVEGQLAAIVLFECLAENDGVDGGQPQVAEETRLGTDVAGVFAAIEIPQNAGHIAHDLLFRPRHGYLISPRATSAVTSPPRCRKVSRTSWP